MYYKITFIYLICCHLIYCSYGNELTNFKLPNAVLPDNIWNSRQLPKKTSNTNCSCGCIVLFPAFAQLSITFLPLKSFIEENFPCANVIIMHAFGGLNTPFSVWRQVEAAKRHLEPYYPRCSSNITAIGYSQGGLVARGVIETTPNHNFTTLITLVSPNMGFSCVPGISNLGEVQPLIHNNMTEDAWCRVFLSDLAQIKIGFAGYYRCYGHDANGTDMFQLYLEKARFLPQINNEIDHGSNAMYKENFIRLQRIISIGIPDDKTACPAEGSLWQTVEEGVVKTMKEQEDYIDDTFGLRTVDERNPIVLKEAIGYNHITIFFSKTAYQKFIYPYLCK